MMAAHRKPGSPWYGPPTDSNGTPCVSGTINAGLLVSNEEGRRWFKQKYGIELADHHRQDFNVPLRLGQILRDNDMALGCTLVSRRSDTFRDFLVITQCLRDCWRNYGSFISNEVCLEDVQLMEEAHEERTKTWLERELGKWHSLSAFGLVQDLPLGIQTSGFKAYFEDED
ncbi:hypothetical protein B0H34DRAFT_700383 [Crassisporium funariophilum]|nr:hypothetical protein B0H34DRAFT_700383 [Crassisporium funariophilum]